MKTSLSGGKQKARNDSFCPFSNVTVLKVLELSQLMTTFLFFALFYERLPLMRDAKKLRCTINNHPLVQQEISVVHRARMGKQCSLSSSKSSNSVSRRFYWAIKGEEKERDSGWNCVGCQQKTKAFDILAVLLRSIWLKIRSFPFELVLVVLLVCVAFHYFQCYLFE